LYETDQNGSLSLRPKLFKRRVSGFSAPVAVLMGYAHRATFVTSANLRKLVTPCKFRKYVVFFVNGYG